jgi:hypothetical protein
MLHFYANSFRCTNAVIFIKKPGYVLLRCACCSCVGREPDVALITYCRNKKVPGNKGDFSAMH